MVRTEAGRADGLRIPGRLRRGCRRTPERSAWLRRLPALVRRLEREWSISVAAPFDAGHELSCAWVAPAVGRDGARAVLKLGMPHMEGEGEIEGLRFWSGDPTVRLLRADGSANAMLIERCEPGGPLRRLSEPEQDAVIAALLRRLWRVPPESHSFRPLSAMTDLWRSEVTVQPAAGRDPGLLAESLRWVEELERSAPVRRLLATDLHAGNVLEAQREPWLVIDPKPFVGDPAYDATQHLLNGPERLRRQPARTILRFADLLGVDAQRVRGWLFARVVLEGWEGSSSPALARALAP